VEKKLARLGSQSHGVVTRPRLLGAGITVNEIKHRLHTGSLIRVYRGVYRVGHSAPNLEARYQSAILAGGEGAVLSGRAAGHLLGLLKGKPPPPEITTPTYRRIEGVRTRRTRHIDPRDVTIVHGIRVTTVARTLVDLAGELDPHELARACHEAIVRYRTTPGQVEIVLARRPRAPGAAKLRAVLRGDVRVTLSILERGFVTRLGEANLLLPRTNRKVDGRWVDCRWPDRHLTVELDSYRYHGSRLAWEQDLEREREARARGDEFRRYTYRDVFEDPRFMLGELRGLLARARSDW